MPNVPKIVPERLKAAAPSAAHPDADLLTAFAEQALPEAERNAVLDHLARCGDCREVVALALPPTEAVQTTTTPVRSSWLTWPTLRWAFVAAGVITIASVGVLQFQRHSQQSMMAYKSPQVTLPESAAQPQASATAAPNQSRDEKQDKNEPVRAFSDSEGTPTAIVVEPKLAAPATTRGERIRGGTGAGIGAGVPHGGPKPPALLLQNNSQFQNNAQQNNAWQQTPASASAVPSAKQSSSDASSVSRVPAANQNVEVSGAAPPIATEARNQEAQAGGQASGQQFEYSDKLSKAKPVPAPQGYAISNNQPGRDQSARGLNVKAAPGQVGGFVVDPSGAVVSNARITITPSIGGPATAVTNSQGAWLIAGLAPGNYRAQAEAPGFKTSVLDFNYDARQPSTFSFTLSPGSASEMVEVSSQEALVQTDSANVGNTISTQEISQLPVSGRNVAHITNISPGQLQSPPRWAINAAGGLQRSFDQGKTWHDVNVIATSAPSSSFVTAEVVSKDEDYAKEANLKKRAAKTAAVIFRAIVANGTDVWAGGSAGVLYHSIDAGSHWTRVVPSASGAVLTGDIISLEFSDPQRGKIATSVPEIWTTADAGQTWQKQ